MKQLLVLAALLLVVQPPRTSAHAALDAFLQERVAARDAPAVVAMVVDRDATLYVGAFGSQNTALRRLVTPDTIFRLASMTKPVTSVAAMMLHEEGRLGLDDPVTKYLPEFASIRVVTRWHNTDEGYDRRPPSRMITVGDLLTDTSGMAYSFEEPHLAKLDTGQLADVDLPLLHDPGARFTYGPGTAVVGRIIERVAGEPLDVFFKTRIFDPLGMQDTSYVVPPDKADRVITVQTRTADGRFTERPNSAALASKPRGDGGLFSTAGDYARFTRLILNRGRAGTGRLLSERSVDLMTSNQIGALTVTEQPSVMTEVLRPFPFGAGKDKFGYGFQIEQAPAAPGLRSIGSLSWGGVQNTHFWIDPQRSIAAVVLMQFLPYYDARALSTLRGFERLVYERMTPR